MSAKQQQKSEHTRSELWDAMVSLFLNKGYEETTIKDIASKAGYAVGSFYKHWPGKQDAFFEFWDGYISKYIKESVENAPMDASYTDMAKYLVERSEVFGQNEVTIKFFSTGTSLRALYKDKPFEEMSIRYRKMLYNYIKNKTKCKDDKKAMSVAVLLHTMLDAHALQYTGKRAQIDSDTLIEAIESMIMLCI